MNFNQYIIKTAPVEQKVWPGKVAVFCAGCGEVSRDFLLTGGVGDGRINRIFMEQKGRGNGVPGRWRPIREGWEETI